MDKIKFKNDADETYVPSDSEEDYSEDEKELLQEVRKGREKDESKQREILAFSESEDEARGEYEEDENSLADSDIEGAELNEDDLPDTKYWGKNKRAYYNTDFVDQDYNSYNEQEQELAKLEEEEAKAIQLRLVKNLKEGDFALDSIFDKLKKSKNVDTFDDKSLKGTLIKADFSGLSNKEQLELFEKDSPEFAGLIGDFEGYLEEIQQLHAPVLRYVYEHNLNMIPALEFAQHYQNIALTYSSNLAFYLLLKAKRVNVENHPIIRRLTQLKKLLNQLEEKHEHIIKPQLEALLERIQDGDQFDILKPIDVPILKEGNSENFRTKSKLGILAPFEENSSNEDGPAKKKMKCSSKENTNLAELVEMASDESVFDNTDSEIFEEDEKDGVESRRGITYQIAKNKGLMPHRKKEQRNPRVKHRGKYRKALIRRKGAVRAVRKEISRYAGEISGIKATVSKSVKFKT